MKRIMWIFAGVGLLLVGCSGSSESEKSGVAVGGMKCGPGKCGSGMMSGNSALVKKKQKFLSQMRKGDKRRDCVVKAPTTKALYDCVRDPKTGRLSLTCGAGKAPAQQKRPVMKCGAGKCGAM